MRLALIASVVAALILVGGAQAQQPPWTTEREQQLERRISDYGRWVRKLQREKRAMKRVLASRAVAPTHATALHAMRLAATIWPVSFGELRSVASCESGLWPFAQNGQYRGVFQEGPMFEAGPFGRAGFSVWDPYANVFTAAYTASRQGWRQWACKP